MDMSSQKEMSNVETIEEYVRMFGMDMPIVEEPKNNINIAARFGTRDSEYN